MAAPCMNKRPHLFLTGEKGVGKSTLLQKLLNGRTAGGFRTVKAVQGGRVSLHLLAGEEQPSEENFLCFCPPTGDAETARRFDRLGCAALERAGDVIVMDELGPAECRAEAFREAVLRCLDGNTPVLGVLQKGEYPFYRTVAEHPKVRLVEITPENRDILELPVITEV